ncbi:MAG: DUF5615 family PIN-like protein [Chloroflexi bacterium]|nr:DUF5615 family PIN-like protein [Chloroflexota bacterium]
MVKESAARVARLYFDHDADARLAEALRRRSFDVETTVATGLVEASDDEQLRHAASYRRALVTHNVRHFPGVHAVWVEQDREHWGIIVLVGHSALGAWVRRMENLLNLFSAEEMRDHLLFLGAEYDSPA